MGAVVEEQVRATPAPPLSSVVRRYDGFRFGGLDPGTHQGLPSGNLTFIVSLESPTRIVTMPGRQGPASFDAFVGGLHLAPATVAHRGSGAGISVEVSPLACRCLFGVPAAALAHCVVDLSDLLGRAATELTDRLADAASWAERFEVLDTVLSRSIADEPIVAREVRRAWQLLRQAGGNLGVAELASAVGWSRRHLSARFGFERGVTPKEAARVLRFESTCALLDRGMTLANAAVAGGYFDQAHLTHEWRALAGASPTAWLVDPLRDRADQFPNLQDSDQSDAGG